ncbi:MULTISPECIES: H-type lectin domain-containing protein [Nostoc]|uniref:RICIN domain-containing protein n=2 Tax=Nostoc TaxID=1177 RepID=A0ABR8IJZ0_9NOSO|nr:MULTISPECIES: H-type lectin domain-containing protein [Nostoc]MBD2560474.1 RICIN domain-containing protein [Nostoc linckia FACHB-391]MBD2651276.1 RICIN domain-containing protein [Nostoc foliaceum FACHB-393]
MAATSFTIISKKSGKALDLQNGFLTDNNPIVQYTRNGGLNQQWILDPDISTLVSGATTNSLDFIGTELISTVNGKQAQVDIASIIADVLDIQTGEEYNGYLENSDWTLHTGSGERTYRVTVKFNSPFRQPPKVSLALSGQDAGGSTNIRLKLIAENITVDGFDLVYKTWFDTLIASAWATWTAIGVKP